MKVFGHLSFWLHWFHNLAYYEEVLDNIIEILCWWFRRSFYTAIFPIYVREVQIPDYQEIGNFVGFWSVPHLFKQLLIILLRTVIGASVSESN